MNSGDVYQQGDSYYVIKEMKFIPPSGVMYTGMNIEEYAVELVSSGQVKGLTVEDVIEILRERSMGVASKPIEAETVTEVSSSFISLI